MIYQNHKYVKSTFISTSIEGCFSGTPQQKWLGRSDEIGAHFCEDKLRSSRE